MALVDVPRKATIWASALTSLVRNGMESLDLGGGNSEIVFPFKVL